MQINEIERFPANENGFSGIHIEITDGRKSKQYMLSFSPRVGYMTVVCGRQWIASRRAFGKTFFKRNELTSHYRSHGEILAGYADQSGCWR